MSKWLKKYAYFIRRHWRLLVGLTMGLVMVSVGFAFLLINVYRSVRFSGATQELIHYSTLQFLPHTWRFVVIGGGGILLVAATILRLGKNILNPFRGTYDDYLLEAQAFDRRTEGPNIVCIGGGIGTAQLIRGLKKYAGRLSVVVHMTDDGGSAGRLRRSLGIPPMGDIVSNVVALSEREELLSELFLYRFKGPRYGEDHDLGGHKLGNLIFAAMAEITGDLNHAIEKISRVFAVRGQVLPVTLENVFLRARTQDGVIVEGEENIDLGQYEGEKVLENIWFEPRSAKANPKVLMAIREADIIILGPGDLYTTILSNLIFPDLTRALQQSKAFKAYILNVANKPYETRGYKLSDFINAFKRHKALGTFDHIFVNNNHAIPIPETPEYHGYSYVDYDVAATSKQGFILHEGDFLESFMGGTEGKGPSIYHDPKKIAAAVMEVWTATREE